MVNKSLTLLALTAVATAAPQLGFLSGLTPSSSKAASSDKQDGEKLPDELSYNRPLEEDDDDQDWSNWEYNEEDYNEDPKDPGTAGSTVGFESDPDSNTTTTASIIKQITSSTSLPFDGFPSTTAQRNVSSTSTIHKDVTRSTTLRVLKSTTTSAPLHQSKSDKGYHSTPIQENKVSTTDGYHISSTTTLRDSQPSTTQVHASILPAYSTPVTKNNELKSYETPKQNQQIDVYHTTSTLQNDVAQPYKTTTSVQQAKQSPASYNRRDLQEGYGKAEFEKQSHLPSTTAAACAVKHSDVSAASAVSVTPSGPPKFDQVAESPRPYVSSPTFAAARMSSSSEWSAVPYSTPEVKPVVQTTTVAVPAMSTPHTIAPFFDSAVPSDAKIMVNTLRPVNTTEKVEQQMASPAKSTISLEKATTATASVTTAPPSMLLQPYYPTTTGKANATSGFAAASTGAVNRSNNTLPEFEGAAASSSSFIAGSVIALAIAAFAL